jgi:hypothetical protein
MDLQTAKLDVMEKIMRLSKASLLKKIEKLLDDELVVGYTAKGAPLTKKAYNKRLEAAEEQIQTGSYITQAKLEKESENW